MKLGYSSIGAPENSLAECERLALDFDLDFVELRALERTLDLPWYFQERAIHSTELPVRVLGSSLFLIDAKEEDLVTFFGFMQLAHRLKVPYVRVFGGGRSDETLSAEVLARAVKVVERIRESTINAGWHTDVLLETHGAFSHPALCQEFNGILDRPIGLIWDSHHTWHHGREALGVTWDRLGPWIGHVHYKDSLTVGGKWKYVLPGQGTFPTQELFRLLRTKGFEGGVSLEWEKLWHDNLAPLETALELFVEVAKAT